MKLITRILWTSSILIMVDIKAERQIWLNGSVTKATGVLYDLVRDRCVRNYYNKPAYPGFNSYYTYLDEYRCREDWMAALNLPLDNCCAYFIKCIFTSIYRLHSNLIDWSVDRNDYDVDVIASIHTCSGQTENLKTYLTTSSECVPEDENHLGNFKKFGYTECRVTRMTPPPVTVKPEEVTDASEQSTTEDPDAEDVTTEDPTAEDVTTGDPTAEDVTTEDPDAEDVTTEDPTAEDVTTGDPTAEDVTTEDPNAEDVTTGDPNTPEPTTKKPQKSTVNPNAGIITNPDYEDEH